MSCSAEYPAGHLVKSDHHDVHIAKDSTGEAARQEFRSMLSRERVEAVLDRIRPLMQADGGDIELVDVHGNSARVRLTGMCSGCPSAHMTLYMGVEMALRDEIKEFEELQVV
jgi:Fe-S cluster biogenesis protein NfuA